MRGFIRANILIAVVMMLLGVPAKLASAQIFLNGNTTSTAHGHSTVYTRYNKVYKSRLHSSGNLTGDTSQSAAETDKDTMIYIVLDDKHGNKLRDIQNPNQKYDPITGLPIKDIDINIDDWLDGVNGGTPIIDIDDLKNAFDVAELEDALAGLTDAQVQDALKIMGYMTDDDIMAWSDPILQESDSGGLTFFGEALPSGTSGGDFVGVGASCSTKTTGKTIYVSAKGGGDGTTASSTLTVAQANQMVKPGDTVILRGGNYNAQINPASSGTADNPIVYKAYDGETPTITSAPERIAIKLINKSYITIDGIHADGQREFNDSTLQSWAILENSHHISIQNSEFYRARGWGGIVIDDDSHHNMVSNNIFDTVGTVTLSETVNNTSRGNLMSIEGDYNLIEGNYMVRGGHSVLDIKGGRYNVVRSNTIDNGWPGGLGYRLFTVGPEHNTDDYARYNVLEYNTFQNAGTIPGIRTEDGVGIGKVKGDNQIFRNNIFKDNRNRGFNISTSSGGDELATHVRMYNNSFYNTGKEDFKFGNSLLDGPGARDYKIKNNLFQKDNNDSHFILVDNNAKVLDDDTEFSNNLVYHGGSIPSIKIGKSSYTLSGAETNLPGNFSNNTFSKSATEDTGAHLTQTKSCSGNTINVEDARYFSNGFGIVQGDEIRIGDQTIRITNIDYNNNKLTVDQNVTCTAGQGVSTAYAGSSPDIGVESGISAPDASSALLCAAK